MGNIVINFEGLAPGEPIPANYDGFNWMGYNAFTESFDIPAAAGPVMGLQMTTVSYGAFAFKCITIKSATGSGQLDVTLKAFRKINGEMEEISSALFRSLSGPLGSSDPVTIKISPHYKNIQQIQVMTNSAETLQIEEILIAVGNQ